LSYLNRVAREKGFCASPHFLQGWGPGKVQIELMAELEIGGEVLRKHLEPSQSHG
jgi:hypothetical protein